MRPRWLSRSPFALATLLALISPSAAGAASRLGTDIQPTQETLRLDVDPAKANYSGTARIELKVTARADSLRFHAAEMTLTRVTLSGKRGKQTLEAKAGDDGMVAARIPSPLAPGVYTLEIEFTNDFDLRANGLYKVVAGDQPYAFTDFEPDDARRAWPCWDEPSFKIPWQITVTIPAADRAVSNTPVESEKPTGASKTVVFRRTKPLPSYLVALAAGPLEMQPMSGLDMPANVVTVKGQRPLAAEAARITPPILKALEAYFGIPYPYEKLDLLGVPEFYAGAMENAAAITFREEILLADPAGIPAQQKTRMSGTIAHELAHMWFGDLVTLAWWNDVWLNESFASWLSGKIVAQVSPELHSRLRDVRSYERALLTDARPSTRPIVQPVPAGAPLNRLFDELAYQKGEAVLGMFENALGAETFRAGVVEYIQSHEWGNATSADLWRSLSHAANHDVGEAMATFVEQPGVPLVRAERLPDGTIRLSQERFHNAGATVVPERWQVPVSLKYDDGGVIRTQNVLLKDSTMVVRPAGAARPKWIFPNAGSNGYYRWIVPSADLTMLADSSTRFLDDAERLGFLGNCAALLDAGLLHGDEYLRIVSRFADDPEPEVVSTLLGGLLKVRNTFVTDDTRAEFAAYVRRTLTPSLRRWGRGRTLGESEAVSTLRPGLLTWLASDGQDATMLAYAESLSAAYRQNPASVDPAVAEAVLDLAAMRGDRSLFDEYLTRFENAKIPVDRQRYLGALAWFRTPELKEAALAYALQGPLRPQERAVIPRGLGERVENQEMVYQWMTKNYATILSLTSPTSAYIMPFFAAGCSRQRLEAARAFFQEPEHNRPGLDREVAKVSDVVNDCANLNERESVAVVAYLKQATAAK